jgi:hypothetical protein
MAMPPTASRRGWLPLLSISAAMLLLYGMRYMTRLMPNDAWFMMASIAVGIMLPMGSGLLVLMYYFFRQGHPSMTPKRAPPSPSTPAAAAVDADHPKSE